MRCLITAFSLAFAAAFVPTAFADPAEDFAALVADYEAWRTANNPIAAGQRGDLEAAARWPDASFEAAEQRVAERAAFLERLNAIEADALNGADPASYTVLRYLLEDAAALPETMTARIPFTNDSGFHTSASFTALSTRLRTVEEAEAWIARINALPQALDQQIAWLQRAIDDGWTQPREILDGVADQIDAQIVSAEESTLFMPFAGLPGSMPEAERERLRADGLAAIETAAIPAFERLSAFFRETYIPAARTSLGARELPGGEAFYRKLVRRHTTLEMTPEEVHQLGLSEVARIRTEMDAVIEEAGFEGTFAEFVNFLRTDPQFYAQSERELMMVAAYLSKKADDAMPAFFNTLPRLSYGVRPVPAALAPNYTTARYWPGDADNGRAGGYMVNTYQLNQRPLYEMPALTVHEAVPGHHHQIAIAQELEGVPEFRKQTYITSFGEGWALYTEHLGVEMGMYETPYEHFGRLTYEMWRACRLVVDTGIHWYGWTRDQAEACFLENSALAPFNIRNEVSRYIAWPGQALAYKPGELLIRRLRADAAEALGEDFNLAAFHDHILDEGALPLSALEAKMRAWIEVQAAQAG
ncbi:MAG: DUF885 domain-containing protein [Pseudomonadota bacterium]